MDYRQVASKGEHMVSVEFENVNKQYDDGFQAVKGLSLDIKDKEFLVLLGHEDAGTSEFTLGSHSCLLCNSVTIVRMDAERIL